MKMSPFEEATRLTEEADKYIREVWSSIENPEGLSTAILKLSILNAGLGNELYKALELHREAESELKYQREKKKLEAMEKGETAAKAESLKITETQEIAREALQIEKLVTLLKLKREDIDSVTSKGQSRLGVIKKDMVQA